MEGIRWVIETKYIMMKTKNDLSKVGAGKVNTQYCEEMGKRRQIEETRQLSLLMDRIHHVQYPDVDMFTEVTPILSISF